MEKDRYSVKSQCFINGTFLCTSIYFFFIIPILILPFDISFSFSVTEYSHKDARIDGFHGTLFVLPFKMYQKHLHSTISPFTLISVISCCCCCCCCCSYFLTNILYVYRVQCSTSFAHCSRGYTKLTLAAATVMPATT